MSTFLEGLGNELEIMKREIASLPQEFNCALEGLDRIRLRHLFLKLEQQYSELLANEESARKGYSFARELASTLVHPALGESVGRLKEPPNVRIIVGKGQVMALAISRLAREDGVTTFDIARSLVQLGYKVLGWDQYQKLLDEISNLVSDDKQRGVTEHSLPIAVGVAVPIIDSTQEVKILPKSSPS